MDAAEPGSAAHLLLPGQSDLTLKLKGINPDSPPDWDKSARALITGALLAGAVASGSTRRLLLMPLFPNRSPLLSCALRLGQQRAWSAAGGEAGE